MPPPRRSLVICSILAVITIIPVSGADNLSPLAGLSPEEDKEIKGLRAHYKTLSIQVTEEEWTRPMTKLQEQYGIRMAQLQKKFAGEGNLEKALAARSMTRASELPSTVDSKVTEIAAAQRIVLDKQDQFRAGQREKLETLTENHVARLNKIKLKLTRQGRLNGALIVEKEIQAALVISGAGTDIPPGKSFPKEAPQPSAAMHWELTEIDHSLGILGAQASLAHTRAGQPAIAYFDDITNNLKFATLKDEKWRIITIASTGNVGSSPSLRFSPKAHPAISYLDLVNGELKFTMLEDKEWTQHTVDKSGDIGHSTSLSFGNTGQPAISYYDLTNNNLKFASFDGSQWNVQVIDSEGDVGKYSSLGHAPDGHPSIAYYDTTNGDLKFASFDGSQWSIKAIDQAGNVGRHNTLDYSPAGLPSIAYRDNGEGNLKYASFNGTEWIVSIVDREGDVGQYTSLKHAPGGQPTISYYDATNGDLKLATSSGKSWVLESLDRKGDVGWFNSLSYSPDGQPSVAYRDNTSTSLKIASKTPHPLDKSTRGKPVKP